MCIAELRACCHHHDPRRVASSAPAGYTSGPGSYPQSKYGLSYPLVKSYTWDPSFPAADSAYAASQMPQPLRPSGQPCPTESKQHGGSTALHALTAIDSIDEESVSTCDLEDSSMPATAGNGSSCTAGVALTSSSMYASVDPPSATTITPYR